MAASDSTFEDLTGPMIRLLAGSLNPPVATNGLDRAGVQAALVVVNAQYTSTRMLRLLPTAILTSWCTACGVDFDADNDTRAALASKLYCYANPPVAAPAAPAAAAAAVPDLNVLPPVISGSMPDLSQRGKLKSWANREELQSFEQAFKDVAEVLGIWSYLEPAVTNGTPVVLDRMVSQRSATLKGQIRNMLSEQFNMDYDKSIVEREAESSALGLLNWVRSRHVELGEAQHTVNEGKVSQCSWKSSGTAFSNWVQTLRTSMNALKLRHYPTPLAYATALRRKMMDNVDRTTSADIKTFLDDIELLSPESKEGSPEALEQGLVQRFTRHLLKMNKSPEQDCQTFSVELVSLQDVNNYNLNLKRDNNKLKNQNSKLSKALNQPSSSTAAPTASGPEQPDMDTMWGQVGSGGGYDNRPWCRTCENFFAEQGLLQVKAYACRHTWADCYYNPANSTEQDDGGENSGPEVSSGNSQEALTDTEESSGGSQSPKANRGGKSNLNLKGAKGAKGKKGGKTQKGGKGKKGRR